MLVQLSRTESDQIFQEFHVSSRNSELSIPSPKFIVWVQIGGVRVLSWCCVHRSHLDVQFAQEQKPWSGAYHVFSSSPIPSRSAFNFPWIILTFSTECSDV